MNSDYQFDYQRVISNPQKMEDFNEKVQLLEQITGDIRMCIDDTLTGLKLMIEPLFNYNTRLIVDFLGMIMESPNKGHYMKYYKEYLKLNTATARFAARSIIKGLILQGLYENDNLFKHLKAYSVRTSTKEVELGLGHSRKILTILYNQKINESVDSKLSFGDLMSDLFAMPRTNNTWLSIPDEQKENVSEILYYMNSYNRKDNDWIQFIDMQYEKTNENVSLEDYTALLKELNQNSNKFTLRITHAGEAYLKYIISSFEFFSVRYSEKYVPLFATFPDEKELNEFVDVKQLKCIKILDNISDNAIACIKQMLNEGDIQLFLKGNQRGIYHKERIKNHHRGYIDSFIKLIYEYIDREKLSGNILSVYNQIVNECRRVRDKYNTL